ncbi:hypothetical protein C4569_03350 [Candidatus Parcubacteria bacterium]|nr:MAG: hypothetical protein C4569_03350 [Candidatus Parcubacteria bacterium]
MKSSKKLISAAAILGLFVFSVMPVLAGEVAFDGTGKLLAYGNGNAAISGQIDYLSVSATGTVVITDNAGDVRIAANGFGEKTEIAPNQWQYSGTGSVLIKGSDLVVEICGEKVQLSVRGVGTANLTGEGAFKTKLIK